ncbi:hypothetical protein [Cohnella nanjingensis]|uniref:Uncharacterized protein n=1 Tax=Cohnella nanjingensis TaxID=1387779 RepID=A0A7X0VD38_9BACL|nr:hypothetical protein [Cohnella nanjingensis]MBB6669550.1 hypothetical protein [Cohnella nanjingensis]
MAYGFAIEPQLYIAFEDEEEQLEQCKEWGLLSEKATKGKTFYYKGNGMNEVCSIVGYVDKMTAVIAFGNTQKHCIHPAYLKEMQAGNFGQRYAAKSDADDAAEQGADPDLALTPIEESAAERAEAANGESALPARDTQEQSAEAREARETAAPASRDEPSAPADNGAEPPKAKAAKARSRKIELPEEKVKMVATVQAFATVPNHFADNDDEVVIYEAVSIVDSGLELGEAWSSHSATIKKLDLAVGDHITFEAKVVAKKLTRHPVPYKINNPARIQKVDA